MERWRPTVMDEISSLDGMGIHGFLDSVSGSSTWLMLRFGKIHSFVPINTHLIKWIDIAVAINSRMRLATNLKSWQRPSSPQNPFTEYSSDYSHLQDCLFLCARVADFWQSAGSKNDVDTWAHYKTNLQALEKSSSSEMSMTIFSSPIGHTLSSKPGLVSSTYMIPTSFPISIYTNRLFFYVQFLSHLSYILLNQCKPRQIQSRAAKGINTASWHAVQICGLALSNPILWSWDPVAVAALLFVGPLLSYSEQQVELLLHLKLLRRTTGWNFDQEIHDLQQFWKSGS